MSACRRSSSRRRGHAATVVNGSWCLLLSRRRARCAPATRSVLTGRWRRSGDGVLDGPAGELSAPAQAGLLADARQVVLDRARRDVQLLADLVVGETVGDQAQDLELTRRQQRAHGGALTAGAAGELAQQVAGELGCDDRAAAVGRDDRLAQLL